MTPAPIPSANQAAMKDARPAASAASPSDTTFGALLSQEIRQQRDSAPSAESSGSPPASDAANTAPAGKAPREAKQDGTEQEKEASTDGGVPAAAPEILALMSSVEQLRGAAPAETPGTESEAVSGDLGTEFARRRGREASGVSNAAAPHAEDIQSDAGEAGLSSLTSSSSSPSGNALPAAGAGAIDMGNRTSTDFSGLIAQETGSPAATLPPPAVGAASATGAPQPATTASTISDVLPQQVGSQEWNQGLGTKLVWMAGNGLQTASLSLNPPELGPLKIVVNLSGANHASASFISAQPEVRQAIESALPRLRELMGEAGIQLGQATVDAGGRQGNGPADERFAGRGRGESTWGSSGREEPGPVPARTTGIARGTALVDTFA